MPLRATTVTMAVSAAVLAAAIPAGTAEAAPVVVGTQEELLRDDRRPEFAGSPTPAGPSTVDRQPSPG